MISTLKCQICLDNYDSERICPRICVSCGHTICEKCLIDIKYRTETLKCPFCKNMNKEIWPKNLALIGMVEFEKGVNLCQKHKRAAVSLCSSQGCSVPVAICDLGQCSKLHKQKGTNTVPLSLFGLNTSATRQRQNSLNVIDSFYGNIQKQLLKLIRNRKIHSKAFDVERKPISSTFKSQTNRIITQIFNTDLKDITSDDILIVKKDILQFQDQEIKDPSTKNQELVKIERKELIQATTNLIQNIKIDYLPKQFYEEPANLGDVKLQPQFQMIQRVVGVKFSPYLIFDSNIHTHLVFKSRIVGQPNLVFYVQLDDGTTFGVYLKRTLTKYFFQQRRMVDFDSFVFWVNQGSIHKASQYSTSNYDMGPQHFISIGNTNNWDGFWFKSTFKQINQDSPKSIIKSSQFQNLQIPLKTKKVKVFRTYQLDFE